MAAGPRPVGAFCWINVLSPNSDADRPFFSQLLDWTYIEIPGMGHRIQVGGRDAGGMFPAFDPATQQPTPPGIGVMVRVESADAAGAKATALGGSSKPAFDVGPQGRMADCHDPLGANIDVWQPAASPGMECDPSVHGSPSWFELATTDVARATAFYTGWFGWTTELTSMGDFDYTTFKNNGAPVGGMMPILPSMGSMPTFWAVYMTVSDCDAAAARATTLGGQVCMPPMDIPNVGRFAGIVSPTGVMFYVITYAMPT